MQKDNVSLSQENKRLREELEKLKDALKKPKLDDSVTDSTQEFTFTPGTDDLSSQLVDDEDDSFLADINFEKEEERFELKTKNIKKDVKKIQKLKPKKDTE